MTQAQLESKIQEAIDKSTEKIAIPSMQIDHRYRSTKQRILSDVEDHHVSTSHGPRYEPEGVLNAYNNAISDFKEELQARLEEIYRELILDSM